MEPTGAISQGHWSSLSGIYTAEEDDFMALLLNSSSMPNGINGGPSLGVPSTFWPCNDDLTLNMAGLTERSYHSLDFPSSKFDRFSQVSSYSSSSYMSDTQPLLTSNCSSISMDSSLYLINGDDCLNQEMSEGNAEESAGGNTPKAVLPDKDLQLERQTVIPKPDSDSEDKSNKPTKNSKKRSVSSGDAQKNKRNVPSKKNQKLSSTINKEEDGNLGLGGKRPSSCSLEDDCNASQEPNGAVSSLSSKELVPLSLNGKKRASRGSATDPQSLYGRKRRERINERLRTLQNLVPNGTKVDISKMLEEAVQYVKFLQLQIKLLSSDNLWMYAPIAYNGKDIGLDQKIMSQRL